MTDPLTRILVIIASNDQNRPLQTTLSGQPALQKTVVSSLAEAQSHLVGQPVDLMLITHPLAAQSALDALPIAAATPILFLIKPGCEAEVVDNFRPAYDQFLIQDADDHYLAVLPALVKKMVCRQGEGCTAALQRTALALASTLDLDQVIEKILEELAGVIPYDSASVQILRDNHMVIIGARGFDSTDRIIGRSYSVRRDTPNAVVLRSRRPLILSDIWAVYPEFSHDERARETMRAWLGVPLIVEEQVVGMLTLDKSQPDFYTAADGATAMSFALQAAIAIKNARLHQELAYQARRLAVLHEIGRAISATLKLNDVYLTVSHHTARLLNFDWMSLTMVEGAAIRVTYVTGLGAEKLPVGSTVTTTNSPIAWVIERGESLLLHDIAHRELFDPDHLLSQTGIRSVLITPLRAKRQIIGTWNIGSAAVGGYTPSDLEIAQSIADQLVIAIENAQLFKQAQQEIGERRRAETALAEERAQLARRVEERTAALRTANAELARAARLKDEFLANVSHELRTPLNAILGFSEVLREQLYGPLNDEQRRAVGYIDESGRHLLDLITDILDLSKIEAGKLNLVIEPVIVADACQASVRMVKQVATKKGIAISLELDEQVSIIRADQRRLKQILVNLLSNAVKFTPQNGQIGLTVRGDADHQQLEFTVWDTGVGIAAADMERLFKPFVQLDSSYTKQHEGTGLGLSLVWRLAEMHGGRVTLESEVGQGSRFTVLLPWQSDAGRLPDRKPAPDAVDGRRSAAPQIDTAAYKPLLLLAEDNEANIATMLDFLSARGYRLQVARDGQETVEQATAAQPDAILMDIQMPVMSGLEAIRRIRAIPALESTPIIALTALVTPGVADECLAAGADEYLSKPINFSDLLHILEALLFDKGAVVDE